MTHLSVLPSVILSTSAPGTILFTRLIKRAAGARSRMPTPARRSARLMMLQDRPMSVRLEKTDLIIVGNSHAAIAGRAGIPLALPGKWSTLIDSAARGTHRG
jgi:hypothetical protein